jgi:2OG-Fe(II) oxygenase superfamily
MPLLHGRSQQATPSADQAEGIIWRFVDDNGSGATAVAGRQPPALNASCANLSQSRKFSSLLTSATLTQLVRSEIAGIHVREFYPADIARAVAQKAICHEAVGQYSKGRATSVGRIYMPHIDTHWDARLTSMYHDAAIQSIHDIRGLFYPWISPVDHLRLLLSELWPAGSDILRLRRRQCFVGTIRVFEPGTSELYPHNDRIDLETNAPEIAGLVEQLAANIYLEVPADGGELQLWERQPTAAESRSIRSEQGLSPARVGLPARVIQPAVGDLVMFSSMQLHAVTPSTDGPRVGMAAFIGYRGPDKPLFMWS